MKKTFHNIYICYREFSNDNCHLCKNGSQFLSVTLMKLHFKEQMVLNTCTVITFCLWKRHWLRMTSRISLWNCAVDTLGIRQIRAWKLVTFYLKYLWYILWHELWSQGYVAEGSVAVTRLLARNMHMAVEVLLGDIFSSWFSSKSHTGWN